MNYPLIKKFLPELKIVNDVYDNPKYVVAKDLEAELAKGAEIFGQRNQYGATDISLNKNSARTHSGLLLNYKPIQNQEPVSREEIEQFYNSFSEKYSDTAKLLKRILDKGVRND